MNFTDLQRGDAVFVDANTLIYHFTNHPKYGATCTVLMERIEQKEILDFASSHRLADVAHRIMTIEAMGWLGWPASRLAARLKEQGILTMRRRRRASFPRPPPHGARS